MNKTIDMRGKTIGMLTVLGWADERVNGQITWRCLCECGVTKDIPGTWLRSGRIVSCGCHRKNIARAKAIDLTGRQYGDLKVVKRTENDKYGPRWLCKCLCGNKIDLPGGYLKSGLKVNCGCKRKKRVTKLK